MKVIIKSTEELIVKHIENNGQKLSWLDGKIGLSVGHLHSVLKGEGDVKRDLTPDNLIKINKALNTNF